MARPLAAELPQDPVHGGDAALGLPEDDALPVGVHGVLPHGATEHAAAGLAEPERPLVLAIDLHGAVEDAAEADAVLEDAVDLEDGVVRLLGVAVGHVIHVKHHLLHFSTHGPASGGGGGCCGGGPYGVWVGTRKAREGIEASAGGGWSLAVAREERRDRQETVVPWWCGGGGESGSGWSRSYQPIFGLILLESMTTGPSQRVSFLYIN